MTTDRSNDSQPTPDWDAIARFLADESSDEEAVAVRRWLAEHPADEALVSALDRTTGRLAGVSPEPIDVEAALARTKIRRDAPGSDGRPLVRSASPRRAITVRPPTSHWRRTALRAASIVGVAALGVLAWRVIQSRGGASVAPQTFTTGIGQRDSVNLPDGSRVLMAPGSQLIVSANYGNPQRDVQLRGEALFDVKHDDAHAFTVHAGQAVIRDIGTVFTVRSREASTVRVVVREGAVLLDAVRDPAIGNGGGVVLHQGDVGDLTAEHGTVAHRGAALEDDLAWTHGRLVFRDTPIPEVAAELKRWYGVELRVTDPTLAARHLNTLPLASDSREQVLETIAMMLGATVEWHGDTAIVTPAPATEPERGRGSGAR